MLSNLKFVATLKLNNGFKIIWPVEILEVARRYILAKKCAVESRRNVVGQVPQGLSAVKIFRHHTHFVTPKHFKVTSLLLHEMYLPCASLWEE